MKVYIIGRKTVILFFVAILIMVLGVAIMPWNSGEMVEAAKAKKDLPIYCVETERPEVSISFDAAWGADDTDDILAALDRNEVKATFFLVSNWIERYPDEVKKIYESGHDIGNHSDTHPQMDRLNRKQIKEEIMGPHDLVKELLDIDMELFRAPYGAYNDAVVDVARGCGYYTIQWNVDSLDWRAYGKEDMYKRVVESDRLRNGSIILFHNNAKYTADALDEIIKGLREKGFELVPISELIMREDYYIDHTGRQCKTEEAKERENGFINPMERNCDEVELNE
ncbi:polysaccharide deacetylase family protein [Vallitalea okinawensis]|uniref:polysaccharide deacetylase family protein n=1 Tax=Vallitalea okinawensis TaxID=2078660 RepID=UPI001FA83986|nr:polysaccharide deacetylase family protein [Vallitalea okinawensis]